MDRSPETTPFTETLRTLRFRHGIKQTELATLLGVSRTNVNLFECGRKEISEKMRERIIKGMRPFLSDSELNDLVSAAKSSTKKVDISGLSFESRRRVVQLVESLTYQESN